MSEEWRPIPGYEGRYSVSNLGRVRNDRRGGRILRGFQPAGQPRLMVTISSGSVHTRVKRYVHQLVLEAFVGPRPAGMPHVRHLNGDALDNRLVNLKYGTVSENAQDAIQHGTNAKLRKTHCARGHEYTPENTRLGEKQQRVCKECQREKGRSRASCPECGKELSYGQLRRHRLNRHGVGEPLTRNLTHVPKPIPHGTDSGYALHRYRKQPISPDDSCGCRAAHAKTVRERKLRKMQQDAR